MVKISSLFDALCVKHRKMCRLQGLSGLCIMFLQIRLKYYLPEMRF